MNRLAALSLLIPVFFIFGCLGQTNETVSCPAAGKNDGLIITDFSFAYSPIYAGERVDLDLDTENIGGKTATLKRIEIFGPEMSEGLSASELKWGCLAPCGPEGNGLEINSDELKGMGVTDLDPPDTTFNVPGDTYPAMWTLQAPPALETKTNYNFNARISFKYETVFSAVLTAVSSDYLRTLSRDRRDVLINAGGLSQACTSGGPISITAAAGRHFVDALQDVPIIFKVSNVGSGFTYWGKTSSEEPSKIEDATRYRLVIGEGKGIDCQNQVIQLSKGETGAFKCTFDATTANAVDYNKKDITFNIPITYYYYVDASTPITVERSLSGTTTLPTTSTSI